MNHWQQQDYRFNFKNLNMEPTQIDGEINFAFNASKQNFGNLATYFHGPSTPCVGEALAYHETKRNKKGYTKTSKPNGVSVSGVLRRTGNNIYLEIEIRKNQFFRLDLVSLDGIVSPKEFIDLNNVDEDGFKFIGPKKRKKIYTLCSSNGGLYLKNFKYQLQQTRRKINTFLYVRPNRYEELFQLNDEFDESYDSSMEAELLDEDLHDCCQTQPF
jgi:hypothetical protein